ncbi:MAG: hypothetical protein ACOY3O_02135 [Thermodesulfobacteriota bacterium]
MSNDKPFADKSALQVGRLLSWSQSYSYSTSYNANENWLTQLLQVYTQKKLDQQLEVQPEEYWYWLRNMDEAPEWFRTVYTDSMDQFTESNVYNDPYLIGHVNNYVRDLYNGKRVVIVAHSQGNFYANNAYRRILNDYPQYQRNIGIVGVATPASMVHGWNNSNASIPYGLFYTTNASDLVINLVRAFYPATLPPNPAAGYATALFSANHGFVDTYLDQYGPFRNRIRDQILRTISLVETPELAPECRPVSVETLNPTNISTTSVQLVGRVTGGRDVHGGFLVKPASDTSPLSCYDLNMPTTGTLKAGDQFYSTVSLQPDTTYYYRACARNGDNISSGAIVSFKTNAIPVRECGSAYVASGGSEGMEVHYDMGTEGGTVHLEFNAYQIPDKLEIWHGGNKIYDTGFVSGVIDDDLCHESALGPTWIIKVTGNADPHTAWTITVSCPGSTSVFDTCH